MRIRDPIFARLKALIVRPLPKVGPLSGLAFHPPPHDVEQLYMNSFNTTLDRYRELLLAQQAGNLQLPHDNLDTREGQPYPLAINSPTTPTPSCSGRPADKPYQTNCDGNCSGTTPISKNRL